MSPFRRSPPPLWYILHPSDNPSREPVREGPYTRSTISHLLASNRLPSSALFWTNEKIWPNPEKPRSARPIRIAEWRRLDQLPDPVIRELHREAAKTSEQTSSPTVQTEPNAGMAPNVPTKDEYDQLVAAGHEGAKTHVPASPQSPAVPAAPSSYPAGSFTAAPQGVYPRSSAASTPSQSADGGFASPSVPGVYPQPGAYPQPGVYPQ